MAKLKDKQQHKNRKRQILQALATMLEQNPGGKVTTAKLAAYLEVSEAALYRHFPSKAKMFEGLIEFIEVAILQQFKLIQAEPIKVDQKSKQLIGFILQFIEKNPGISRLLAGDAMVGEQPRLRQRISLLYNKIEIQFKNLLRDAELNQSCAFNTHPNQLANLWVTFITGKITRFVASDFSVIPSDNFDIQWQVLNQINIRSESTTNNLATNSASINNESQKPEII